MKKSKKYSRKNTRKNTRKIKNKRKRKKTRKPKMKGSGPDDCEKRLKIARRDAFDDCCERMDRAKKDCCKKIKILLNCMPKNINKKTKKICEEFQTNLDKNGIITVDKKTLKNLGDEIDTLIDNMTKTFKKNN